MQFNSWLKTEKKENKNTVRRVHRRITAILVVFVLSPAYVCVCSWALCSLWPAFTRMHIAHNCT